MTSENDTRGALAREMYWAEEATPRSRMDTPEVRDALHDFAMLMRDDEKAMIPRGLHGGCRLLRPLALG